MKSIRVIGLTDIERHALNSVVRLSTGRNPSYTIWQTGEGRPDIFLLDSGHPESRELADAHSDRPENIIWVGADAPDFVETRLKRPIAWVNLLQLMDSIITHHASTMPHLSDFAPTDALTKEPALPEIPALAAPRIFADDTAQGPASVGDSGPDSVHDSAHSGGYNSGYDSSHGADSQSPIALSDFNVSGSGESRKSAPILYLQGDDSLARSPDKRKRVLIVDANTSFRLYLKAVLSVGNELLIEETANLQEALHMTQELAYDSVLIDLGFASDGALALCKSIVSTAMNLRPGDTRISRPNVYFLSQSAGPVKKFQAKRAGANGILIRPRSQEQLDTLFSAVNRYAQG